MQKNRKFFVPIIFTKANVLIILFLSFTFFRSTTYAIYKKIADGNGGMVAAQWNVSLNQTNEEDHLNVVPGANGNEVSYTLNIISASEVNITYKVVVDNIPVGVSVLLDGDAPDTLANNKATFNNVGTINYNDAVKTKSHVLTFSADSTATIGNNYEIDIDVIAQQTL